MSLKNQNKKDCVVVFKDNCLDKKELISITKNFNKEDSERIANIYAKDWIIREKLYEKAQKNISVDEEELERSLSELKKQYVIAEYIKFYLQENLDSNITEQEIINYYQQHKNSFKLSNNIVQVFYVKLTDSDKDINTFKKLLVSASNKNQLNQFIVEKSSGYFMEDSLWLKWDDLIKEAPTLKTYDINYIPKGKTVEWRDGTFYYYIKIKDYKVKNEYSPIAYEKEKIKNSILNERKNNLITELKNQVLEDSK